MSRRENVSSSIDVTVLYRATVLTEPRSYSQTYRPFGPVRS
jgi:hypothetical protein